MKVSRRTHKSPAKYHTKSGETFRCNQFKNLTYENMERFIKTLPKRDELMEVYDYIRYGAGLVQTSSYTAVRRWFVAQFPDFRENPLSYFNQDFEILTNIEPIIKEAMVVADIIKYLSERNRNADFSFGRAKLKVSNRYVSDVVEKFGDKIMMIPLNDDFSTAVINEPISPATYIWTLGFDPRIEITFPVDAEEKFQTYFSKISRGEDAIPPYTLSVN